MEKYLVPIISTISIMINFMFYMKVPWYIILTVLSSIIILTIILFSLKKWGIK